MTVFEFAVWLSKYEVSLEQFFTAALDSKEWLYEGNKKFVERRLLKEINKHYRPDPINSCITWGATKEGYDFWEHLNDKWRDERW